MGKYDKVEITFWDEWGGLIYPLIFLLPIFLGMCLDAKDQHLRDNGVVIEKTVKPAWISSGDNYYFLIRFDSDEVMKKRVGQETYMKTNVGDRINWNPY